jgi:hypothetical protein
MAMKVDRNDCTEARLHLETAVSRLKLIECGDFSKRQSDAVTKELRYASELLGFELGGVMEFKP